MPCTVYVIGKMFLVIRIAKEHSPKKMSISCKRKERNGSPFFEIGFRASFPRTKEN